MNELIWLTSPLMKRTTSHGENAASGRDGWLLRLGLAPPGDSFAVENQTAKVRRAAMLWPAALYAQLVAIAIIATPLVMARSYDALAIVSLPAGCMLALSFVAIFLTRAAAFWRLRPDRQVKLALPFALALGGAFGVMAGQVSGHQLSTVALAGAAMLTLAALIPLHAAMLAFAAAGIGVCIVLLGNSTTAILGIALLSCLWAMTLSHARFDHYLSRVRRLQDGQSRRATRLIADFEANGLGWFWETDRAGELVYVSKKLAALFDLKPADMVGKPFAALIKSVGSARDGERTLGYHLSTRSPFSDLSVRAAVDDEERWWSISGQPIIDAIGQFRGYSGSGTDLTEKRRSDAEAVRLARFDELTGLANRQEMRLAMQNSLRKSDRHEPEPIALLLLDLDRFKTVNDTMGHPVGDALLKQVSQRLFTVVGEQGKVGRLGGDEFQVLLPGITNPKELSETSKGIIAALSQPYMVDGITLTIGCSVGIAVAPENGETSEDLVRNADLALYAAKGDGRGVHRFFKPEMHSGAKKRKRLEDDLRHALNNGELFLTYQPVVGTKDERIVGYEALIRWEHPSHGAISPTDFIPIAEDIRLIEQIGEWVLRTACKEAMQWPGNVRVAVNVSPIQFANPALPGIVASALSSAGLAPDRLELEITEGVFLDEGADTDNMFKALKSLGVRLALDDFGTGYSSLGYLKSAPFNKIKIDQSFIRGAAVPGNRNAAIVRAIVTLAETLYMETTAEGVEIEDEIELVRELGCSHIQGFIYGKPMPAEEVIKQLSANSGKAIASGFRASRSPRTKMLRSAAVAAGEKEQKVRIRDLSATGAMVEGLENLEAGSEVLIEIIENELFPARVRWQSEDRAGIEFARGFDLERLAGAAKPELRAPLLKKASG